MKPSILAGEQMTYSSQRVHHARTLLTSDWGSSRPASSVRSGRYSPRSFKPANMFAGVVAERSVITYMLRFHELRQNPVSVTCREANGATYTVTVMRLREGLVKMTCQCQRHLQEGWCQHCLAMFSDRQVFEDDKQRQAFERLVGRTYLEEAATKLTQALDAFAVAYTQMKTVRPSQIDRSQLRKFAERAYRASVSSDDLVVALDDFINEAAARRVEAQADQANTSARKEKWSALEMVRRALTKDSE
jgi:hypothetical protein